LKTVENFRRNPLGGHPIGIEKQQDKENQRDSLRKIFDDVIMLQQLKVTDGVTDPGKHNNNKRHLFLAMLE